MKTNRHIQGRSPCDDTDRNWSSAATSQGMPRIAGNHQKLWRGKEGFFPRAFRGGTVLLTLWFQISSLQNCERINFCCFKLSKLWYFATAALGNEYRLHFRWEGHRRPLWRSDILAVILKTRKWQSDKGKRGFAGQGNTACAMAPGWRRVCQVQ